MRIPKRIPNRDIEVAIRVMAIIESDLPFTDKLRGVKAMKISGINTMSALLNARNNGAFRDFTSRVAKILIGEQEPHLTKIVQEIVR